MAELWASKVAVPSARIIYGATVEAAVPELKPKLELGKSRKKSKKATKAAEKQLKIDAMQATKAAAEAAIEKRRFVKRCTSCDRKFLRHDPWVVHSAVCQSRGGETTKAMTEAAALRDRHFKSLEGCAVEIKCRSDFPIPQDDGYAVLETIEMCMLSWQQKFEVMRSKQYGAACANLLPVGWATKENCRRPSPRHPPDVRAVLRQCFGTTPRMNNYQIHQRLKRDFRLGPKVLRISQISGWITGEIKRRKGAAIAAVADAANMVEEASQKGVSANLDGVFEAHTEKVLSVGGFESAVAIGMNPKVDLDKWKHSWRWDLFPARRQHSQRRPAAEAEQWQQAAEKQLRKDTKDQDEERKRNRGRESASNGNPTNKRQKVKGSATKQQQKGSAKGGKWACEKGVKSTGKKQAGGGCVAKEPNVAVTSAVGTHVLLLLPGQAWSNCCGAPVAEMNLDKGKNCKDQSAGSECSKRRKELGKRKRKPAIK